MAETLDKVRLHVDRLSRVNVNNNNAVLLHCQSEDISRFPAKKTLTDDVNDSVDATSKSIFRQPQPQENERSVATDGGDGVNDGAIDLNIFCDTSRIPYIENNPLDVSMGYENSFKNELRKAMITVAQNRNEKGFLKRMKNKLLPRKDPGVECTTIYCQCIETVVTNSTRVQPSNITRTDIKPSFFSVLGRLVAELFGCDLPEDT